MSDEIPDFEGMSIFELLEFDNSLKQQGKGFGSGQRLDAWLKAITDKIPFYGIIETLNSLENQLFELQAQFERLVIALDKQLDPVAVPLKDWIKR